MSAYTNTVAPDFCPVLLDSISANQGCLNYPTRLSQVDLLILALPSAGSPTDWTNEASWQQFLDNQSGKAVAISVIGGVPEPEKILIDGPRGYQELFALIYTLNATLTRLPDDLYEFSKQLQCPDLELRTWYANETHLYGGEKGLLVENTDATLPLLEEGFEDSLIDISWTSDCDPARTARPFETINHIPAAPQGWIDPNGNFWRDDNGNNWIW